MKNIRIFITLFLISFIITNISYGQSSEIVSLTETEKSFVKTKGTIHMVVDPDWYPYEKINPNGQYIGIAPELIALIESRTGLKFEVVKTKNWKESLSIAKSGEAEVVSFLNKTEERSKWLLFTEPYFEDPNVLITREEHDYISNLKRYENETMVLPEGTSIEERLRKDYPKLNIILVKDETQAIQYIEDRKADFTLRSLTMAAYVIKNEGRFNLKVAGEIPTYKNQLRMGITNGDEVLQSIINKGIKTITEQDVQEAINQHVSITVMRGFDYQLFFILISIFAFVLSAILYWMRKIHILNRKLEVSEKNYRQIAKEIEAQNALLEASATTDTLTGLKNRLYFNQKISEEFKRFNRYGTRLSLLMIDIDHFKRINDRYGHTTGDEVLITIAHDLQNKLREIDLLARWGGEEFIALLPDTSIQEAMGVAEKLREKAESINHANGEVITISIGVTEVRGEETIENWIKRTDKALYLAKEQGRNCYQADSEVL